MAKAGIRRTRKIGGISRRMVLNSVVVVVAMFSFGYVMAPLYDTICRALGIGGKTDVAEVAPAAAAVDTSRTVTVEFTGHAMAGLPWEFRPLTKKVDVRPGKVMTVAYYVRNPTSETIV